MRVICINEKWKPVLGSLYSYPEFGEIYNAVREVNAFGYDLYILAEWDEKTAFIKTAFIPADEPEAAVDAVNEILETVTV